MRRGQTYELPTDREETLRRAVRLEWLTVAYLASIVVLVYLVMGSSQAMKAAWIEDMLSFIPPIAFLVAQKVRQRGPDDDFPYGYHRAITVGFLVSALALATMGLYVLIHSTIDLVTATHPSIGLMRLFGHDIWQGWLMIAVMLYASVPMIFLGRAKRAPARHIHDKVLHAGAAMNAADWKTGGATIVGVLGIGAGLWWADAAAAIFISLDITYDGLKNLRDAVGDIMDRWPRTVDHGERLDLDRVVGAALRALPFVADARLRLRDMGHVVIGEAMVVSRDGYGTPERTRQLARAAFAADWRMYDLAVEWVDRLPEAGHLPVIVDPEEPRA